jgi:ribosomal protein S18 acetylase RimI-like enzyme/ketosteroid isomerase-like protein
MSRENVEIVRRGAELYSAYLRDQSDESPLDALVADMSPDVEIDFSRILPDLPPTRGTEAMRAWNKTIAGLFDELRLTTLRTVAVGEAVVSTVRLEGRGAGSGAPVDARFSYAFRLSGGKIVAATTYASEAEALAAAGLRAAVADDEPFLTAMVRLAAGWRDDAPAPMTPALERYVRGFGRPGDRGVVVDGQGAAWLRLLEDGHGFVAPDVPELAMAVVPAARGLGLGGALLARLIAGARGHPALSLSVEPGNPALRLYERHGFEKVGESGGAWTMLRRLHP